MLAPRPRTGLAILVLSLAAAACSSSSESPAHDAGSGGGTSTSSATTSTGGGAPSGESCDEATFVYLNATAQSVLVTGTFADPPWPSTAAAGALPLTMAAPGVFVLTTTFAKRDRYLYKFIVDGGSLWAPDPLNPETEPDGTGQGVNSVVNRYRVFAFSSSAATAVSVTGSFTTPAWSASSAVPLQAVSGFSTPVFAAATELPAGTQLYKFIVDGGSLWTPDPWNTETQSDGQGGVNSVAQVCHE